MHYAAAWKHKNCMDLLLEAGGSLLQVNDSGQAPLEMASDSFAALFQLQKTAQLKLQAQKKGIKVPNKLDLKSMFKKKQKANNANKSTHLDSSESGKSIFTSKSLSIQDFKIHSLLGTGSFGDVYLVEKKDSKKLYAMKVLLKEDIFSRPKFTLEHSLERYALTEKNVLSQIRHPFIVRLHFAFQTSLRLFMILDYCPGGDLGERLQEEGLFSEEKSKMYLAEMILALEEVHSRDIIYRDLKPDNILLDRNGHAMLTDFGLSKEDVSEHFHGAKSFCGSVAYLAPEMLKRAGHGKAVDWYLVGVVLYEMLTGFPPYYAENKDELFKNIQSAPLKIPSNVSDAARSLLKKVDKFNNSSLKEILVVVSAPALMVLKK